MGSDKRDPGDTKSNIPGHPGLPCCHLDPTGTGKAIFNKEGQARHSYANTGRIMVLVVLISAILLLILVIAYIAVRHRNRRRLQASWRQPRLIFSNRAEPSPCRLDQGIVNSIPVIELSLNGDDTTESCAVCISEFAHGEKVRVLPQCHHRFHLGCIDMWFDSHSTCPLCRCDVNLTAKSEFVELEETQNKEVDTAHVQGSSDCFEQINCSNGSLVHQSPLDHIV